MKKIAMLGVGYVGLVSGTGLADFGNEVICYDIDTTKIEKLNNGEMPIYEPGLIDLVRKNVAKGRLKFTDDLTLAIRESEVIFLAVPTPSGENGEVDLSYIFNAVDQIAKVIDSFKVIVTKSTVEVGTNDQIRERLLSHKIAPEMFEVVSNPEFLREGSAVSDFMRPDRIVIGTSSPKDLEIMKEIYRPLYLIETPIVATDIHTAEMIKYASNAFLATKISFINEIANLCELVGADVQQVAKAMGLDGRIGKKFLHAGPGYGGSCFPKDTLALTKIAEKAGMRATIVEAVIEVNNRQKLRVVEKLLKVLPNLSDKTIGILGLAFKPNTNDVRETPALTVIEEILKRGGQIKAYDPEAMKEMRKYYPQITYVASTEDAAKGADALIIMTEWNEFRNLDLNYLKSVMKNPIMIDSRNIYDPQKVQAVGFIYDCIGRKIVN
ncbi:MAG TPA: UDP-glucose/GDP-mannose dehydrogenase family protein [Candidatus Marinimicrobia bacterium]|nr:UDP-glucose/GDP-mannose dehydrogenase family protein [Candidatus Neomarinimicrobiota bacterium]HQE95412.1 UDP-glucose/GDP-mannose dehydrogenase family protein [Candidatus Neomarinimicrobiota bacterium]HQH56021.1 UDP-glucose/GDP-mannose dehydrogenase family protein [Candidatus Neomarinimicrobiota bacterium]HQK11625.1 UDP-glucose/GDP-mannose dehydrogenase family protein [Candidatus Neomarinimicrobiota bacterium]